MKINLNISPLDLESDKKERIKNKLRFKQWYRMFGDTPPEKVSKVDMEKYIRTCEEMILAAEVLEERFPDKKISELNSDEAIDFKMYINNKKKRKMAQEKFFSKIDFKNIVSELKDQKLNFDENSNVSLDNKTSKGRINPKAYSQNVVIEKRNGEEVTLTMDEVTNSTKEPIERSDEDMRKMNVRAATDIMELNDD